MPRKPRSVWSPLSLRTKCTTVARDRAICVIERMCRTRWPGTAIALLARMDGWRTVARIGGWAAIAMLAMVPLQVVVYAVSPPPESVIGWYELFERNRFIALVDLDLLLLIDYLLAGLVFLALWVMMRGASPAATAIMLGLELLAIATYIASNPAIEMMSLADRYAGAATDAQRQQLIAAGEAAIASWTGTAFTTSYILSALAALIGSVVMLRTRAFSRATGVIGVVYGVLNLVPSNAGMLGLVLSLAVLIPMLVWLVLIARGLLRPVQVSGGARDARPKAGEFVFEG